MTQNSTAEVVRVHADHTMTKHLGNWTTARTFQVRTRRGAAVIDLRSPEIADGDIELDLDIDHGMVKLLLPADATVDQWGIQWTGAGKVKDGEGAKAQGGRRVRLTGRVSGGEVRIHRGGMAILSAMFSRAYLEDLKRAHRDGAMPTVDDPTRTA
ncbi:hypothetical protein [Planotetraspora mira]|uniref:Uncharacterized protein n=1 Tax=Planotetraspora mira TaxID=58121 RepID=A0A8J3TMR2_9ACTN|nr:hypothetical protein [Planotetraspora mira]GII28637.1 hypothetical protein Pmi06nite_20790 [Planotetraspora mira]